MSSLTDIYVRDKHTGAVHKVGTNQHDALIVDENGTVHYYNMQNGCGCGADSRKNKTDGYEFLPGYYGDLGYMEDMRIVSEEELNNWKQNMY